MAETSIEWADFTFNCWRGCQKVSPACKFCYAENRSNRFGEDFSGQRIVLSDAGWKDPVKWNKKGGICTKCGGETLSNQPSLAAGMSQCCDATIRRRRVFCASLADVFEDWDGPMVNHKGKKLFRDRNGLWSEYERAAAASPPRNSLTMHDVRRRLFALIDATPNLDWLLLTKRPENIIKFWGHPPGTPSNIPEDTDLTKISPLKLGYRPNVWIGTTVENQPQADKRIPGLLKCRDLSPCLFLSCEPLLGPVGVSKYLGECFECEFCGIVDGATAFNGQVNESVCPHCHDTFDEDFVSTVTGTESLIDWVIAGGESGPNARPSHPDWFRGLRDQCAAAGVPFHFKQWGEWSPGVNFDPETIHDMRIDLKGQNVTHSPDLHDESDAFMDRVGKKKAGRLLEGSEHNGTPKGCK